MDDLRCSRSAAGSGDGRFSAGVRATAEAISVLFVAALAHPDFLLEVEATAVIPEE